MPVADLPDLTSQAERLIGLGLHEKANVTARELRAAASGAETAGGLLVIHPDRVAASQLAPLMESDGPIYVVDDPQRSDDMANWSPDEALPALLAAGRRPLTLTEGIHWLLQQLGRQSAYVAGFRLSRRPPRNRLTSLKRPSHWGFREREPPAKPCFSLEQ